MSVSRRTGAMAAGLLAMMSAGLARGDDGVDISKVAETATKSLVLVEYTYRNENVSQEESGQGIVLNKDGVILISGTLIPESLPKEYIRDIKVRLPLKQFTTVPAKLLGRTTNRLFAYVKADKAIDAPPLEAGKPGEVKLGQEVFAVALMGKAGGYEPYTGVSRVKAVLHLAHNLVGTGSFGLTRANSPVFDLKTGVLVGVTFPAIGESMVMRADSGSARMETRVELKDDDQSGVFLPMDEVTPVMADPPGKAFDSPRPWIGIDGLTGVDEDMRAAYGITQAGAVAVGSVIPGESADKAGLKGRDIILTIDGKEFTTSPVPGVMVAHLQRRLERVKVGDEVKVGILRDGKTKMELTLEVRPSPKLGSEMPQVYDKKLEIATRDLVFGDTYSRKLPADTKGVIVALVKQGAAGAIGQTPLRPGYLITKVNDQDVEDQKSFAALVKAATDDPEKKEIVFRVIRQDGETQVCRIDLSK